jgi:hypothetical protein
LLAAVLAIPAAPSQAAIEVAPVAGSAQAETVDSPDLLVRKGRGSGGRRSLSGGKGGGSRRSSSSRKGRSGFKSSGSRMKRGSKKPRGGWSKSNKGRSSPSMRDSSNRYSRSRQGSRNQRNRNVNRRGDRDFNRRNTRRAYNRGYRRGYGRANRNWRRYHRGYRYRGGWARAGWGYARPWNYGWYGGWSSPSWGWWGANAAVWGITSLANAAIINSAVDNAVESRTEVIVVPNTDYELYYGSVQPSSDDSVTFLVKADDGDYEISADCNAGTIDGLQPGNAAEAELLNAACQVAFGSV